MKPGRILPPILSLLLCAPLFAQKELSPSLMEEDLFFLTEELQRNHAGLHRFTKVEEFDELLGETLFEIGEEPNELEFFRLISHVASEVRCGHTRVRLSDAARLRVLSERLLPPFQIHLVGERAWILSTIGENVSLEPGDEILSLNGQSIREIREVAFRFLFDDGFIESAKERELEARFALNYSLLVDDARAPRQTHLVEVAGREQAVEVSGVTLATYAARKPRAPQRPFMSLEMVAEDVAHLYVREFGDPGGGEPDFPTQLEAHFAKLKKDEVSNLILDLRGNGGGADMYGALLVSYLSPKAFRYFDNIRVTADYEGDGGIVERDGARFVTAHPGLREQRPAKNRFEGRAFILTDGWTFSTAADVATVAHHNGLATFVGEESGGGYDGNTSGNSKGITLPNSGLEVSVPQWMYTTANVGHDHFGRGVPPDHHVRPTIEDALQGKDAEIEKVLQLVGGS